MKWVKLEEEMDPNLPEKEKKLFQAISLPKLPPGNKNEFNEALRAMLKQKGFKVWVEYPVLPGPGLGKRAARKYEIFCGGFLYYHDVEFKKYPTGVGPGGKVYPDNKFEHKIFFEWLPKGKSVKKKKLRMFINETPPEFNPDPPKPPAPPPPESNP